MIIPINVTNALSRFPTKQVLTPMKYNGEMSASLGTCKFCCREIEPSSTTVFEFVVVGDDFNGTNGSKSGGIKTCVCLSCYEASRPCCKWCKEPLHKAPTVKGQDVHRDCFMKYENKHGDRCHVCKELLWEEDKIGGFQRRTHMLKALSLGAKACSGGRLYLYALAAGGKQVLREQLKSIKLN